MRFSILLMTAFMAVYSINASTTELKDSLTKRFFADVGDKIGDKVFSGLWGYGLSAIGLGSSSIDYRPQLKELRDELKQINATLVGMNTQLVEINLMLEKINCNLLTSESSRAISNIIYANESYQNIITADEPTLEDAKKWLKDFGPGSNRDIAESLSIIDSNLTSASMETAISACLTVIKKESKWQNQSINDADFFIKVASFLDYYYYYQTVAMGLAVEAYHLQAYLAYSDNALAKKIDSPLQISEICFQGKLSIETNYGSVSVNCNAAKNTFLRTYRNLVKQYDMGGVGYGQVDSTVGLQHETSLLWMRSLDAYASPEKHPYDCKMPLTSNLPCGPTVGKIKDPLKVTTYSGYTVPLEGWRVAKQSDWGDLLIGYEDKKTKSSDYMTNQLGFDNSVKEKIVYTEKTSTTTWKVKIRNFSDPFTTSTESNCFIDTNLKFKDKSFPMCSSMKNYQDLNMVSDNITVINKGCSNRSCGYKVKTTAGLDYSNSAFYKMDMDWWLWGKNKGVTWNNSPQWRYETQVEQYRWPVNNLKDKSCIENPYLENGLKYSPTNVVGVYKICGEDFQAWLDDNIPFPKGLASL